MNKAILGLLFLICFSAQTFAQRMVPGQKGLEINAGISYNVYIPNNGYLNLGFTKYVKSGDYLLVGMEYGHEVFDYRKTKIPIETFSINGGYILSLLGDNRKRANLTVGLLAVLAYETFNHGETLLSDGSLIGNDAGLAYGTAGQIRMEIFLCDYFTLILQGKTTMLWNTTRNQFRPSSGIGLRFNL